MSAGLQLSPSFALPAEAVTNSFAVLGKRGSGKTQTASVMAEEMLAQKQQIVAIDPTGAWWGLRSGHSIAILGGEHADVPLEESAGEVVARAITENRFSCVVDLSLFRKAQMYRFMVPFCETLYRLNREALHLFVDEADSFAPQGRNYGGEEARLLGAMEDIVRRGRIRGIGCSLITQRPAVLNKNVLTQCETLVAMRLVHPRDINAVMEWVNVQADERTAADMVKSLPSLPVGTAWVWSPGWGDIFERVAVRRRHTFDSSATPKPGEAKRAPKSLAKLDLAALGNQIRDTVEKAKADDPKELRKTIAALQKELKERPAGTKEVEKRVEVPVLKNGQLDRTHAIVERAEAIMAKLGGEVAELRKTILPAFTYKPVQDSRPEPRRATGAAPVPAQQQPKAASPPSAPSAGLTGPQQTILDVVLMLEARGLQPNRDMVARWIGIHPKGGSYGANLGHLRQNGYLDTFVLTGLGRSSARTLATGLDAALDSLDKEPKKQILRKLVEIGKPVNRDELAEALGLHPKGGSYGANLGWIRTMGLITEKGPIQPTAALFN